MLSKGLRSTTSVMSVDTGNTSVTTTVVTGNVQGRKTPTVLLVATAVKTQAAWVGVTESTDNEHASDLWGENGYHWLSSGGGTGLAVKAAHAPRVVRWRETEDERATMAVFQYGGRKVGVAVVRLKANQDRKSEDEGEAATTLNCIHREFEDCDARLCMGDLNQVARSKDRVTGSEGDWTEARVYAGRQIAALEGRGYRDMYRALREDGGYTHVQVVDKDLGRRCKSRLDYVFVKPGGVGRMVAQDAEVLPLGGSTTHSAVMVRVTGLVTEDPRWESRAPFKRLLVGDSTIEQKAAFCRCAHVKIKTQQSNIRALLESGRIEQGLHVLNALLLKVARDNLAWSKERMENDDRAPMLLLRARRIRRALSCVKDYDQGSRKWKRRWKLKVRVLDPDLRHPPSLAAPTWTDWLERLKMRKWEVGMMIKGKVSLPRPKPLTEANRDRYIRKVLRGGRPNELDSVMKPDGTLAYKPMEVQAIVEQHVKSIAQVETKEPEQTEWWSDSVERCTATPQDYAGVDRPITAREVRDVLNNLDWNVAAGPDGVPGGLLKLLIVAKQGDTRLATESETTTALSLITAVARAIFDARARLDACRDSITKPLWKKEGSKEPKNIRPIALQNAITKLPSAVLAKRLTLVFERRGILHPAQEAFLKGGRTENVLWTVLNIWSTQRKARQPYYNVMYDWVKAYDSLPWWALEAAMRRIRMPESLIEYVLGSLRNSRTRIRTAFGLTDWIEAKRGVKQGDPLAPLLYIIAMDILHEEIHHQCSGFRAGVYDICSKGYADDTIIGNSSWDELKRSHEVVLKVCSFMKIDIHPGKTALIGVEADGRPIDEDKRLSMPMGSPEVKATRETQKLLGLWADPTGDWTKQENVLGFMVHRAASAIRYSRLPLEHAVYAARVHLWTKLAYRLKFFKLRTKLANTWQKALNNAVTRRGSATRRMKADALSFTLGYPMIGWEAKRALVLETYRRMTARGTTQATTLQHRKPVIRGEIVEGQQRTILRQHLQVSKALGLCLVGSRGSKPMSPERARRFMRVNGREVRILGRGNDHHRGDNSGPDADRESIEICVDGSFRKQGGEGRAGWAAVFITDELRRNWRPWVRDTQPIIYARNYKKIQGIQGRISYSANASYDPELEAVAWALQAIPLHNSVRIFCDNEGVVKATMNEANGLCVDKTKRFHLLTWIRVHIQRRRDVGFQCEVRWIASHQDEMTDVLIAANEVADARSKKCRLWGSVKDFDTSEVGAPYRLFSYEHKQIAQRIRTPLAKASRASVLNLCWNAWRLSRSQAPGWEGHLVKKWVKGDTNHQGRRMRLATGTLMSTEHRDGVEEYRVQCLCSATRLCMEHLPRCGYEPIRDIWAIWHMEVVETLKAAGRTLKRDYLEPSEDHLKVAQKRIDLLVLARDPATNRMQLKCATGEGRRVRHVGETALRRAALANQALPRSMTSSTWRANLEAACMMDTCDCEAKNGDQEWNCSDRGKTFFPDVTTTMMRLYGSTEQIVASPLDISSECRTWWTLADDISPAEGKAVVHCTGGEMPDDSYEIISQLIQCGRLTTGIIISDGLTANIPQADLLVEFPMDSIRQQTKNHSEAPIPDEKNTLNVRVWVIGRSPLPTSHGLVLEDLHALRREWVALGAMVSAPKWESVCSSLQAAHHRLDAWAERTATRLQESRVNGRAFYGVWSDEWKTRLLAQGLATESWKRTSGAISDLTVRAFDQSHAVCQDRLTLYRDEGPE